MIFFIRSGTQQSQQNDLCAQQRQGVFAVHMRVWVSSVYRCHPGYGSLNNIILTISLAFQVIHDFLYTIWNTTKPTKWPMCQAKIEISLGICPVWSESPLSIWRFKSLATHIAHSKGSDSVATVGKIPGKWIFFQVREKSGNFAFCHGKLKIIRKVREFCIFRPNM